MTELVLEGWDPEWVESEIREQSANLAITIPWAERTKPVDTVRWELKPEWDYLNKPQG